MKKQAHPKPVTNAQLVKLLRLLAPEIKTILRAEK